MYYIPSIRYIIVYGMPRAYVLRGTNNGSVKKKTTRSRIPETLRNSGKTSLFVQRRRFQKKKSTTGILTTIDKHAKPLEESMILHQWPATIQERPKRTWTPEVDAHEGHSGKPLEFLEFRVGAG